MALTGNTMPSETAAVTEKTLASKSSFLSAMRILPTPRRQAMYALYAFCRVVDDIADDGDATSAERLQRLEVWRMNIGQLFTDPHSLTEPVACALIEPIRRYHLRQEDFLAVIEGMEMDAHECIRRPSLDKLDHYCDCVAAAVGRLSIRIFGDLHPPQ